MQKKSPAKINVREMSVYDIRTVFDIGEQAFTSEYSNIYRTWDEYEVTTAFTSEGEFSLIAACDNKTVGFALGTLIEKGTAWTYGHLVWLGIDPKYHRKGIGGKLIKAMKRKFKKSGARIMLVDTQSENTKALDFFHKHGFNEDAKHLFLSCHLSK